MGVERRITALVLNVAALFEGAQRQAFELAHHAASHWRAVPLPSRRVRYLVTEQAGRGKVPAKAFRRTRTCCGAS